MLSLLIFFPLVGVLAMYLLSKRVGRTVATVTSGVELALAAVVALRIDWSQGGVLQLEERVAWVPTLGASYHLAVDGLSVPLILLTALLTFLALLYAGVEEERSPTFHATFLVMETALIGLFSTQDLLLFYLFWEASLVPMYFIIGVWGHAERVKSALKFFLFTRLGGLALLLAILGLYLGVEPHTFDLPTLVRAQPYAGTSTAAALVLLCFLIAFGIKLPVVPLHTWLPDAHTEAPTEGSVLLAGVLLKMGGYGLVRLALPTVGDMLAEWALVLAILAVVSGLYGAAVAMAQEDLKRLVAYSSVNHMAYVLLAVSVAAMLGPGAEARQAALTGAVYQLVAHGLATGALFFLVGMIARRAGTREISKLSGLWGAVPVLGTVLAVVMFASLGLPGLAHFAAEVQIVLGALAVWWWAAAGMLLAVLLTTAMFVWTLQRVLMGRPEGWKGLKHLSAREGVTVAALLVLLVVLGIFPGPLAGLIEGAAEQVRAAVLTRR